MKYAFFPGCAYHTSAGYKESVDAVTKAIGLDLVEIPDWNCCGATTYFGMDAWKAKALAARILALAQAQGYQEIVTICNACFSTLRKANEWFTAHPESLRAVNCRLREENLHIDGPVKVRHCLEVLVHDVSEETWTQRKKLDVSGILVGSYYGCQLNRPWNDLGDPEHPTILDDFLKIVGFTPVEHSAKTQCCGASHAVTYAKDCRPLIQRIIGEIHDKGAHMVTTICPLCQFNLDAGQNGSKLPRLPVPYFSQLAGLALDLNPERLGLTKLLIPMTEIVNKVVRCSTSRK